MVGGTWLFGRSEAVTALKLADPSSQARSFAPMLGDDADLLEAAAWLHDIGEAEERGLADELAHEFPQGDPTLSDALSYCDMTTTPTGQAVSVHDRLSEITQRYGPGSIALGSSTRLGRNSFPVLTARNIVCAWLSKVGRRPSIEGRLLV